MDQRKLQVVISAVDQASKVIKNVGDNFKGLGDLAERATAGAGVLSGGLALVAKSAIDAGSQLQQARIAFNTMIGDSELAGKTLADLSNFAAKTPFTFPGLVEASKSLLAYNIEAGDLIPTLEVLGNISAGVGTDKLPQLILAFGQVKAATRLTGMELRQFTEAGVPLLDTLAKQSGITAAQMQEMISGGEVSFDDVNKALRSLTSDGGRFFNLMQNQSRTLSGVMSNLSDNLFRVGAAFAGVTVEGEIIAGGLFDRISQVAEKLLIVLDDLTPKVSGFMDIFLNNTPAVTAVLGGLMGLLVPLGIAFASLIAPALLFVAAGVAIGAIAGVIINNWSPINTFFSQTLPNALSFVNSKFDEARAIIVDSFNLALEDLKNWLEQNRQTLETVAAILGVIFGPALIKTGLETAALGLKMAAELIPRIIAIGVEAVITAGKLTVDLVKAFIQTSIQLVALTARFVATTTAMIATKVAALALGGAEVVGALAAFAAAGWAAAAPWAAIAAGVYAVLRALSELTDYMEKRGWITERYNLKKQFQSLGELLSNNLPHFADGVTNFQGGLALVGERGPEIVRLPRGSDVIPNNQIGAAGTVINQTNHIYNQVDIESAFRELGWSLTIR